MIASRATATPEPQLHPVVRIKSKVGQAGYCCVSLRVAIEGSAGTGQRHLRRRGTPLSLLLLLSWVATMSTP